MAGLCYCEIPEMATLAWNSECKADEGDEGGARKDECICKVVWS